MNNCDAILAWMKEQAESKQPIDPFRWLEAAEKLNAMIGDETDKLIELQQLIARAKIGLMEGDSKLSVAKINLMVEANGAWVTLQKQAAKIGRIMEAIRLAKLHSRLKSEEMRNS